MIKQRHQQSYALGIFCRKPCQLTALLKLDIKTMQPVILLCIPSKAWPFEWLTWERNLWIMCDTWTLPYSDKNDLLMHKSKRNIIHALWYWFYLSYFQWQNNHMPHYQFMGQWLLQQLSSVFNSLCPLYQILHQNNIVFQTSILTVFFIGVAIQTFIITITVH